MIRFTLSPEKRKEINNRINKDPEKIRKTMESLKKLRNDGKIDYSGNKKRMTLEVRKKISKSLKEKGAGGYRIGSGRSKKTWYESVCAGRVYLRSTYELEYVKWLDKNGIKWKPNLNKFPYIYQEKLHYYYPDFYLIDEDIYIEIKGYKTEKDLAKWKNFPYKLKVLMRDDLRMLGCNILK